MTKNTNKAVDAKAMTVKCPRCGAEIGEECKATDGRRLGDANSLENWHVERLLTAMKA